VRIRRLSRLVAPCLLILFGICAIAAPSARAQGLSDQAAKGPMLQGGGGAHKTAPNAQLPNALPGSQTDKDRVIPAEHSASDMSPTDALFDAVNRGDLAAARDAIARGADFNSRNELGLTPLDESIDLGRNNITFLLLSLRTGPSDTAAAAPSPAAKGPGKSASAPPSAPALAKPVAAAVPAKPAAAQAAQAQAQAQAQTQAAPSAGNPGTPSPQHGFLGFGG
jgi:hypothetical protein